LVDWIVLGCSIICGAIIIKKKRVNYLSFLFSIPGLYWGVYASTKDQLLIAVLGLLTYFTVANPIKNFFLLIIGFIFLILLAPLGLLWFSLYRSGVIINMEALYAVLEKGVIRNTDPAGPIAVFNDLFNSGVDMKFGSTYLDTFYLLVPKFVWANRPLDVAEKYAQETLKYWLPGQGLGYSLLIEGYINFSYFGVFIQYFTTGLLWGITWNLVKKIVLNISVYIWLSLYSIFGFFLIIIIHRSPFSGTPKQMFLTLPIILFVLFLFNKKKINEE
jgi:oligosaccharide repeat unit polymerase